MVVGRRSLLTVAAILLAAWLAACSGIKHSSEDYAPTLVPKPNFYIRTAIDQDPSIYLGRFIPDDISVGDIDEAVAMQLSCSRFFKVRKVPAVGIEYDEYFSAGAGAAANLPIPKVQLRASSKRERLVRVVYEATEKWVAELTDPAAFEACCKSAPDQCTTWYIGEFLAGTGTVMTSAGESSQVQASSMGVGAEVKDGIMWQRSIKIKQPAFFAFKRTRTPYAGGEAAEIDCDTVFVDPVPLSSQGTYFVGVSDFVPSEQQGRDDALLNARRQVIRFLGEEIRQASTRSEFTRGAAGMLDGQMEDVAFLERASEGLARYVKDRCWDVEEYEGPDGWLWKVRVLAFIPRGEIEAAVEAVAASANAYGETQN